MTGAVVGSAAAWYSESSRASSGPPDRSAEPSPRAFDARGFATMHHVLVQLAETGLRPRFAEACKTFGDIIWCDDLEDLVVGARSREALALVVDVADRQGKPTAEAVAAIRRQRPDVPIVVWCEREAAIIPLARLVAAGASALVFRDDSDLERRLMSSLTRANDVAFHQLTDQSLYRRVPEPLVPVVRYCLDHAAAMPSLEIMARALGMPPRLIAAELRRAGLPPLRGLVTWARVLLAAYRLEQTVDSSSVVARSVGFPTAAALSRLLRRHANEPARSLREPGGFGWVLRCFERDLTRRRRGPA
jgi:AraC-like DNA-binding protein